MPDTPSPVYAAFSPVIGLFDGQPRIALMSMSRDPGALYWIEPAGARAIAAHLIALADQLDPPPKPEEPQWRHKQVHAEFQIKPKRATKKKRKAKR